MMLKSYKLTIAAMGFMTFLFGVVSVSSAQLKIAVVDVQKALKQSKAGKGARSTLQKEKKRLEARVQKRGRELEKKAEEIRKLQREIQQKGPIWRAEERERKNLELRDRRRDFSRREDDMKRLVQETRRDFRLRERRLMGDLIKALRDVVRVIAREGKYDLILDTSFVLHSSDTIDITDQLIKLYNQKKQ